MRITERREHGGIWWGRDPDGVWYRWDAATSGWEGPLAPPWPQDHPNEAAIVARALAAGEATARAVGDTMPSSGAGSTPPMNRVDRWWNRRFPPFSGRRLVFGLIALPVTAALTELLWAAAGRGLSLPRYLFVCIAGGIFLSIAFLPGMRDMAERLQASGALPTRPAWPWSKRTEPPHRAPPLPPLRETFPREFVIGLPFAAAILLVMSLTVSGPDDTSSRAHLATIAFGTLSTSALIAMRRTVWSLVVLALIGGVLGGFATVLLSLMTWSDPGLGEFLIGWGLGSVMLFLFAYPMWRRARDLEARGLRLPMWLVMGGTVLLVSGAALVFIAEH